MPHLQAVEETATESVDAARVDGRSVNLTCARRDKGLRFAQAALALAVFAWAASSAVLDWFVMLGY